jgi:SAM-dependent methyltransferase
MHSSTVDYYERYAERFSEETLGIDMTPLYERFLPLLPKQGHILDAGCGSGRDARAFLAQGFHVTAFDASPALARIAEGYLGQPVHQLRFQDLSWQQSFDGIWACASLLHVPVAELTDAMQRLCNSLKRRGLLYASFKYGSGERDYNGRRFTDLDEVGLAALLGHVGELKHLETWISGDQRADRNGECWLNVLLYRRENPWGNS